MFKIPDWEDDVPKSNAKFTKKYTTKEPAIQKSLTNSTIDIRKDKLNKSSSTKSPVFKVKKNGITAKLLQKHSQKANKQILTNRSKSGIINETNKYQRKNLRIKGPMVKGSLLRQQKNEKNHDMMNKRLQNKTEKANKNIKSFNNKNDNKTNGMNNKDAKKKFDKLGFKNKITETENKVNKSQETTLNTIVNDETVTNNKRKKKNTEIDNLEIKNFDSETLDEIVINAKKKKLNESLQNDDNENELFHEKQRPKISHKKEIFRKILELNNNRNKIEVKGNKLRERMLERLKAAQFRYLNEKLYTSSGSDAQQLFQSDPTAFQTYHQGYQQQVKKWPVNPLDVIVKRITKMPKTHLVADMGCGEAALSKRLPHKVRSFDLVASTPDVEACDMAHTPLLSESVDVAVYCLALMGTDLTQYLIEANRVLRMGGHLSIAEVESRFDDVDAFVKEVQRLGFKVTNLDKSHKVFFFMEFTKIRDPPAKKSKLPTLTLKPCLYKRR